MMLERARWAASAFAGYDRDARQPHRRSRRRQSAYQNAERYAEWAVRETGMGVVEHKRLKNELCSRGLVEPYRDDDYVTPASTRSAGSSRSRGRPAWCSR